MKKLWTRLKDENGRILSYPTTDTDWPKETLFTLYCKLVETLTDEPLTKARTVATKKAGDQSFVSWSRNQSKTMLRTTKTEGNAYFLHFGIKGKYLVIVWQSQIVLEIKRRKTTNKALVNARTISTCTVVKKTNIDFTTKESFSESEISNTEKICWRLSLFTQLQHLQTGKRLLIKSVSAHASFFSSCHWWDAIYST